MGDSALLNSHFVNSEKGLEKKKKEINSRLKGVFDIKEEGIQICIIFPL